jgi:hypothetical protein
MTSQPRRFRSDHSHLTQVYDDDLVKSFGASFEGMAHFASTGPAGSRCVNCRHWGRGTGGRNRPCEKFAALTGITTKLVPETARACRYFCALSHKEFEYE